MRPRPVPARTRLAIAAGKATARTSRLAGRGSGSALPGLVAERIDADLARTLVRDLPHGVVLVTGTNGKTTTTKLIAAILEAAGERVLTNRSGSNLKRGIVSTLIGAAQRGRLSATIGLFEVDEASLRVLSPLLTPRLVVVTNLFRDQLDRYGEFDITARLIGDGIALSSTDLVLNADDPLVASLAGYARPGARVRYYGIEGLAARAVDDIETVSDSDRCPRCGRTLDYRQRFYGHIGHYRCAAGDFDRPAVDVAMTRLHAHGLDGSEFEVTVDGAAHPARLLLPGIYNLSNALAAIAAADAVGVPVPGALAVLATATAAFGRVERLLWRNRTVYLLLVKNPAGFTQVIDTFLRGVEAAPVLLVINDRYADGRDVSWLWDVPIEALAVSRPRIVTAGLRGADMALRCKYAGVPAEPIGSLPDALDRLAALTPAGGTAFVLPTYTAMLEVRKLLARESDLAEIPL